MLERISVPLFLLSAAICACGDAVDVSPPTDGGVMSSHPHADARDGSAPPVKVGACGALAASGAWEDISPVRVMPGDAWAKNFSLGFLVDPFDPATVWLGTGYSGLWKSTDCGANWTEISTGRNRAAIEGGALGDLVIDPVDRGVLYLVPIYGPGGVWKSANGGVDWDQLITSSPVGGNAMNVMAMDPSDHRHLVVGMHANCDAPYNPTCEAESLDAGATWRFFKSPSSAENNWEEGGNIFFIDSDSATWLYLGVHLWITKDHGGHWQNLTPDPSPIFGFHEVITGPDGTLYLSSGQGVSRSTDGEHWTLIPNSGGSTVALLHANGHFYAADQWSATYRIAPDTDATMWSALPAPAGLPKDQGTGALQYDVAHHLLYSANLAGGLWRVVTP